MINSVIEASNISKNYQSTQALKNVSFCIDKGELFGLIGPDGAGKTTLIRILSTLILANSGQASVNGLDVVKDYKQIRWQVGYMPGKFSLYPDLTVRENLEFFASVFGTSIQQNYHLIKDIYTRLEPFANRKAANLSGGMKQKLALCCALIHAPSILFLDEPTTGVDPSSRREFWEMLDRLKSFNITILVSTAYMDEASRCKRIAMMSNGQFLVCDSPTNIINSYNKTLLAVSSKEMFRLLNDLRHIDGVDSCYTFGSVHHATLLKGSDLTIDSIEAILKNDYHHSELKISPCKASMEDCFMNLEGNNGKCN